MYRTYVRLFILLTAIALIGFYLRDVWQINFRYQETSCTVLANKISHYKVNEYRPLVQLAYTFNNTPYTSWTRASRIYSVFKSEQEANAILNQFQVNKTIRCWVDPTYPMYVEVDKKANIQGFVSALVLIFIICFIIFYQRLYKNSKNQPREFSAVNSSSTDLFEIKEHRFMREYIYHGREPVTVATLPKIFRRNYGTRELLVNKINKEGRLIVLKKPYAYLLGLVLIVIGIVMLVMLRHTP
jgi:hypothetical protein